MYSDQGLLYLVLSIAVAWIAVFLCWALYETALLIRRSRLIVDDLTAKIKKVEDAVKSGTQLLVSGGEIVSSLFGKRKAKKTK